MPWNEFWTLLGQLLIAILLLGVTTSVAAYFLSSAIASGIRPPQPTEKKPTEGAKV